MVVLETPELHGTRQLKLGTNLYLYRDLYLETQESGVIDIGNEVVLSRGVHLVAYAGIVLEEGVMIGEYASVRDANHRLISGSSARHSGHSSNPGPYLPQCLDRPGRNHFRRRYHRRGRGHWRECSRHQKYTRRRRGGRCAGAYH